MKSKITNSVLNLNGIDYDAKTGSLLTTNQNIVNNRQTNIDGIFKPISTNPSPQLSWTKPSITHYKTIPKSQSNLSTNHKSSDVHRVAANDVTRHRPQHTGTLMRRFVTQPAPTLKRRTHINLDSSALARNPEFIAQVKLSSEEINQKRLKRAENTTKSQLVSKFNSPDTDPTKNSFQSSNLKHDRVSYQPTFSNETHVQPPASNDIFEKALAQANSHKQLPVKHKKVKRHSLGRRLSSLAVVSLAILLILGFMAYQNSPVVQIHLASARAGINATLPSWEPKGFVLSKLTAKHGTVAINYSNDTSKSSYNIIQTASHWSSSSALFNNYVYPNSNNYEAIKAAGKIIYAYNNNQATWVSSGVWYKLTSNGSISTSQIINIAASM